MPAKFLPALTVPPSNLTTGPLLVLVNAAPDATFRNRPPASLSTTDRLLEPVLATKARPPSGAMARPCGLLPTVTLRTTVLLLMLSTTTVSPPCVTYARLPSGVMATLRGRLPAPTGMAMTTVFVAVSIIDTEPEPVLAT